MGEDRKHEEQWDRLITGQPFRVGLAILRGESKQF